MAFRSETGEDGCELVYLAKGGKLLYKTPDTVKTRYVSTLAAHLQESRDIADLIETQAGLARDKNWLLKKQRREAAEPLT